MIYLSKKRKLELTIRSIILLMLVFALALSIKKDLKAEAENSEFSDGDSANIEYLNVHYKEINIEE